MKLIKDYINDKQKQETGELLVREFIKYFEFELFDNIKQDIDEELFVNKQDKFQMVLSRDKLIDMIDTFIYKKPINLELFLNLVSIEDVMCDYFNKQNILHSFNTETGDFVLLFKKSKYWGDLVYDRYINKDLSGKSEDIQLTEISECIRNSFSIIFNRYLGEKHSDFISGENNVIEMRVSDLPDELIIFSEITNVPPSVFRYEIISEQLSNYAIDNNMKFREYKENGKYNFILIK